MNEFKSGLKNLSFFLTTELFKIAQEASPSLKEFQSLDDVLKKSPEDFSSKELLEVTRLFMLCLELCNCADRFYNSSKSQKSLNDFSKFLLSSHFSQKDFDAFVKNFSMDIVFTAHPTEVFPLSVLKALKQIEILIEKIHTAKLPEIKHRIQQNLRAQLTALWLTDEIYRDKPAVEDEADRLFYVFENSLWKSTPYFFRRYYWEYKSHFETSPKYYPKLKFSSWIGGDRDGNPFVNAEATEKIIRKSRRKVLRLILRELYPLRDELLIKTKIKDFYPKENFPYKHVIDLIVADIQEHLLERKEEDVTKLSERVTSQLELIYNNLCKDKAKRIADRRVRSLIDRVRSFTLSPLQLDIRQDSEVHEEIYEEVKDMKKIDLKKISKLSRDFFETLELAKSFKPCPFNCYIISMTRTEKDIEILDKLMNIAGVKLDIVPLFETPEDIRNATTTLKSTKKPIKQIMWGYSDSTKKGGRLASAWNLYKAQEEVLKKFPKLIHFHGRGGSIARGGGPAPLIFDLMPSGLTQKGFRQTFQGEVIQDDFGLSARTVQTLEEYFIQASRNTFEKKDISKSVREKLDELSSKSESRFYKDFYENDELNKAFDENSPVPIINSMNLGSRPSKRKSKKKGISYRAIPWVFAWSQSRGVLPIWYGLQNVLPDILKLKSKNFFVTSFIQLISFGMSKADGKIFKLYFKDRLSETLKDLKDIKKQLPKAKEPKNNQKDKMALFLHKVQVRCLNKTNLKESDKDMQIVATQGIASYLGKSG